MTDAKKWVVLEICELCWKYMGNAGSLWITGHMLEMLETYAGNVGNIMLEISG